MTHNEKVKWPARAVVTAGMPYGNKPLHFGHVGGVFVPADAFARFLRDRIGAENVRFVSGTDCYGSPIMEGYRKLVEAGLFDGDIREYVRGNHDAQKATLERYGVSLDIYEGSGLDHAGEVHERVTAQLIESLYENGFLRKEETLQFYDPQAGTFLNGRQVHGRCPVQGCKSENAYADECDLGHQYSPADLIAPKSSLTGQTPEMRPVANWYFDLPAFAGYLRSYADGLAADPAVRSVVTDTIREFLVPPIIFVKNEAYEEYLALADGLPEHEYRPAAKGKQSFELEFRSIGERDEARAALARAGIRFRTGKALVPFRISGNIEWGVPAPTLDAGMDGLTVWCWPESLWAPISFTIAANDERGLPRDSWRDFWCSDEARVYQFIGQDNIYFYGVAQPALWMALQNPSSERGALDAGAEAPHSPRPRAVGELRNPPAGRDLRQTRLIANYHMLLGNKKASSSGAVKPPTADELLEHYTVEQLRAHWLALGLDARSVGFNPKAFEPDPEKRADPRISDPVLKEGALLTKVFNRLARSCLYEARDSFECRMPLGEVSEEVRARALAAMDEYERLMERVELHSVMSLMDDFIRWSNKHWSERIKLADAEGTLEARRQVLVDSCYLLRVCTLLMHPIVPEGCERICDYLNFDFGEFFSWNYDFEGLQELCGAAELAQGSHVVRNLPPRFDFFAAHPSQFK